MFTFLLVVHAIIAAALVAVILMQRSEGGGLGMGGSPSGLMSARGAADFLTRATTVLATLFVLMCVALAVLASLRAGGSELDTSLVRPTAPAQQAPLGNGAIPVAPAAPTTDPLAGAAAPAPAPAPVAAKPAARTERAPAKPASSDPVAPSSAAPSRVAPPPVVRTTPNAAAPANGSETPNP